MTDITHEEMARRVSVVADEYGLVATSVFLDGGWWHVIDGRGEPSIAYFREDDSAVVSIAEASRTLCEAIRLNASKFKQ